MFHKLVCLLFACLKIMVCASPPFTDSIARTKIPLPYTTNLNSKPKIQNNLLLHDTTQIHIRPDRSKRGIVLIDEDFNVPSDPDVKQGWSDGDFHPDGMENVLKNTSRIYSEGSGSSETMGGEIVLTKSTRFAKPDNLQLTSLLDHQTTTGTDAHLEASGDGDILLISNATETYEDAVDVVAPSTHASTSTQVPVMITTSTHVSTSTKASEDTSKGVSSNHVAVVTEVPRKDIDDSSEHLCMNFTCDSKDLIILPSVSETVPEGTNLTLSCALANATEQGSLKWYKYNESDHLLLGEYINGHEINFAIPKTILYHSGTYMCFRFTEQSCCHRKLDITVYEMPNYKQHFIVIGSVAAASLLICILIAICKNVKTKKYEDKVELQNAEKPFLL